MCGICGIYAFAGRQRADVANGRRMRDRMMSRGPDGHGEWLSDDGGVWLGHRRLAIIDLSPTGAQPMLAADGAQVLTYNGEIYNYAELREALKAEGAVFRGTSDSEVLLHLYRRHGPEFVARLRGMFAFAIWDPAQQSLFLARDPYGIKPLYYCARNGVFRFASQVKALVADPAVPQSPDPAGVTGFFLFGSVPEPFTIYEGIAALPAGCTLTVGHDGVGAVRRYHTIGAVLLEAEQACEARAVANPTETMRLALLDSVRHHLVADVPVGAFLSAGVDSGALVGLMRDAGQSEIRTVTLAYDEFRDGRNDESSLASKTAARYGTTHTTRRVTAEEFHAELPRILEAMDQPSVDGINTWFVSKAAHELGLKVAISGVGGDELLGGYSTFHTIPRIARLTRLAPALRSLSTMFEQGVDAVRRMGLAMHPKVAGLMRYGGNIQGAYLLQRGLYLPHELEDAIGDAVFVREGLERLQPLALVACALEGMPQTPFGRMATLEASLYMRNQLLRDADWAGMAHSLEIRTPLVDHVLLMRTAAVICLPREQRPSGKALLATAPQLPLPDEILNRPKTGFSIPVQRWIGDDEIGRGKRDGGSSIFSRDWAKRVAALQAVTPRLASGRAV